MAQVNAEAHASMEQMEAREKLIFETLPGDASKIVEELQREMIRANRYRRPLSMVMIGVEFDSGAKTARAAEANCTQLLRRVQSRAGSVLRQSDHFGRLDDKAVLVVLPETDGVGAQIVAQKLLAGGNLQNLVVKARKVQLRFAVEWRQMDEDLCDVAALLDSMKSSATEFEDFLRGQAVH